MQKLALFLALWSGALLAGETPAVVSNIQILSPHIEDVSSLEAWRASFIRDGMSEKEKALAVWTSVVKFRHQDIPPREYLQNEGTPRDPIKTFNVYGYSMCDNASASVMHLSRVAGLQARGWGIINHSVPEVRIDGHWSMLDGSLVAYFPRKDGTLAGVEDLASGIETFYAANAGLRGNEEQLRAFMRGGNWRRKGPEVLSGCTFLDDNGWFPAATHGWYATMQEYADRSKLFQYEYGAALGYRVNNQLRAGESITWNWGHKGLHINKDEGIPCGALNGVVGKDDLRYAPAYGDRAPGRVGNGVHVYEVFKGDLRVTLRAENAVLNGGVLSALEAGKPAAVEYRMPLSYIYLDGRATLQVSGAGEVRVRFSRNHGLDWKDVATLRAGTHTLPLKTFIFRLYEYRVRIELSGGADVS